MSDRTDKIAIELLALRDQEGRINPAHVVQWARKNKRSHIHGVLTWDDAVAAERHRIWEVRALISVHIRDANGGRQFVSLSIDRQEGGYRPMSEVLNDKDFRQQLLDDALAELRRVEARYKSLTELSEVWQATHRLERLKAIEGIAELPKTA